MQAREASPPDAERAPAESGDSAARVAVGTSTAVPGFAPALAPTAAPARTPPPTPVSASSNLAGRDRFLTIRPFDTITPVDFEIGPLMSYGADASIAEAIAALKAGFADRKLAYLAMSEAGAAICELLYAEALASAPAISETRAGEPEFQAGGGASIALRLFSATGSATGFAVLYPNASGAWLIEHLELDLASLAASAPRETPWDPYAGTDAP